MKKQDQRLSPPIILPHEAIPLLASPFIRRVIILLEHVAKVKGAAAEAFGYKVVAKCSLSLTAPRCG